MKKKPAATFDDFLATLQAEVGSAQRALEEKQEQLVRRYFDVEPDGNVKAVTWNVIAPAGSLNGNGVEQTIELPLLALVPPVRQHVVEVSLEFEADLEESPPGKKTGRGNLVLVIRKRKKRPTGSGRRIKITLDGPQPGRAKIYVDGTLLKTVDNSVPQAALESAGAGVADGSLTTTEDGGGNPR